MSHYNALYSKDGNQFDYSIANGFWVGGQFPCSNLSKGYHGILKQYWEKHCNIQNTLNVLLISENEIVKNEFKQAYPSWNIKTLDLYYELSNSKPDIVGDICSNTNPIDDEFDLIINQATLEHLYNPFKCMENLLFALKPDGILVNHTHPPGFGYHQYPRDYFRFMIDWWIDLPKYVSNIELLELCMYQNNHVFSSYKKLT